MKIKNNSLLRLKRRRQSHVAANRRKVKRHISVIKSHQRRQHYYGFIRQRVAADAPL
ncbi:hypothetical protein [Rheinheimera salexigens]|uniref:hypothetical protein n=1 Tax=Rheinheimera salexigens TaxID=1628148 RepID=UPI001913AE20|nr:hypothetical protein [Rheinheimera salexigens]